MKAKTIFYFLIILCFLHAKPLFAHPPQEMSLSYDEAKKILTIDMKHTSENKRKHYIREYRIFKNNDESVIVYDRMQVDPQKVVKEIPVDAKNNDVLRVKVFCSEGGTREETLVVKEKKKE